ncbi:hypothetical protein [Peribacillus asahii]|uniref:hypothetical protein n=1 Tax=Peribacillus asahii TaxID=228899 RepID=UPI00207AAC7D|nr:hypothetical protein [Peribacillus asahii]USK60388.1 hypothetical protein LIT37_03280 [Peribacillus asahii]
MRIEHYYDIKNVSYDVIEVTNEIICEELEKHTFVDWFGDSYFCAWGCVSEDNTIILIQKEFTGTILFMKYNAKGDDEVDERSLSDKTELIKLLHEMVFNDRNIIFEHYLITHEIKIDDKFDELLDLLIDAKDREIPWMRVHE